MNPFLLSVRDLTVAFRTEHDVFPVVEDVNFDIEHGCCVGIVGESGCGKSATAMSSFLSRPGKFSQVPFPSKEKISFICLSNNSALSAATASAPSSRNPCRLSTPSSA